MEITVEPSKTYAVTTSGSCIVTDSDGLELCTASSGSQAFFVATTPTVTVSDDGAKVSRATFNFALAALGLLGGGADKLPAGYTRLEFLESTGTQWLKTGLPATNLTCVEVDFADVTADWSALVATYTASGESYTILAKGWSGTEGGPRFDYGGSVVVVPSHDVMTGRHTIKKEAERNYIDAVEVASNRASGPATWAELCLLHFRVLNTFASCKLYSYKKWALGGAVQQHFIPSLNPAGEPCMFDLVTREPFRNAGSGRFIVGMTLSQVRGLRLPAGGGKLTLSLPHEASIDRLAQAALERARANGWELTLQYAEAEVPAGYRRLDFLESTGTQYIDTGVKLSNESEVRVTLYAEDSDTRKTQTPYGWSGDTSKQFYCYSQYYIEQTQTNISLFYLPKNFVMSKQRVIGKCDIIHNAEGFTVNGIKTSITAEFDPFETTSSCRVFSAYQSTKFIGRIHSFTLSRASVAQVDYVPCIAPDGKLGMYNRVDGTLKENAGTGSFIAGLATVDDVRKLWLPETGGELTVSVPADTPDSAVEQLRKNNPTWQIAIQIRTDNED